MHVMERLVQKVLSPFREILKIDGRVEQLHVADLSAELKVGRSIILFAFVSSRFTERKKERRVTARRLTLNESLSCPTLKLLLPKMRDRPR